VFSAGKGHGFTDHVRKPAGQKRECALEKCSCERADPLNSYLCFVVDYTLFDSIEKEHWKTN